jgi:hypothetical protein
MLKSFFQSVCQDGSSDFDSDGYEEVGDSNSESRLSSRPSAMELVTPSKNSLNISRTLWCEIPEVIQSSVLSTCLVCFFRFVLILRRRYSEYSSEEDPRSKIRNDHF